VGSHDSDIVGTSLKLLIAGSRSLKIPAKTIQRICRRANIEIEHLTEVVSGKARGVDTSGESFAKELNITIKDFPADWSKYGKAAGPIRNRQMAEYCDAAIIIWDGYSRGSFNMMEEMDRLRKPYYLVIVEKSGSIRTKWVNGELSSLLG